MPKRLISTMLAAILALCFVACGGDVAPTTSTPVATSLPTPPPTEPEPLPEPAPTSLPEEEPEPPGLPEKRGQADLLYPLEEPTPTQDTLELLWWRAHELYGFGPLPLGDEYGRVTSLEGAYYNRFPDYEAVVACTFSAGGLAQYESHRDGGAPFILHAEGETWRMADWRSGYDISDILYDCELQQQEGDRYTYLVTHSTLLPGWNLEDDTLEDFLAEKQSLFTIIWENGRWLVEDYPFANVPQ